VGGAMSESLSQGRNEKLLFMLSSFDRGERLSNWNGTDKMSIIMKVRPGHNHENPEGLRLLATGEKHTIAMPAPGQYNMPTYWLTATTQQNLCRAVC
jgi:hypothetical protein